MYDTYRASTGPAQASWAHPLASSISYSHQPTYNSLDTWSRELPASTDLALASWARPPASSTCATCPTHQLALRTCTQRYRPSQLSCSTSPSRC